MNFTRLNSYIRAAEQACRLYLWDARQTISLLHLSENATFCVTDPDSGKVQGIMRVSRVGYHSVGEIGAELQWLLRLRSQDGVKTVYPIPNRQGMPMTLAEEGGRRYVCVAFPYLEGSHPELRDTAAACEDFRRTGQIAALLHQDAMEWAQSRKLNRPRWDWEHMVGRQGLFGDWRRCRDLRPEQYELLEEVCGMIGARLIRYGKREDNFGLIHGDLRAANLLKQDSGIQVIDFDDCGFGWHLYDLAASFSFIEDDPRLGQWVRAWLEGYETVLPLREEDVREIPTFIMARRIQLLAWIASHEDSDPVRELYDGFAGKTAELAETYCRTSLRAP